MVVNERQNDWDFQPPHVEFAYNNWVSVATGLAPNEAHMDRLPRLPLAVFELSGVAVHQSLASDHLAYYDLATDRQQRAHDIVRKHHVPSPFPAYTAETLPSPTRCARSPSLPWVVGHGCTTQLYGHKGSRG